MRSAESWPAQVTHAVAFARTPGLVDNMVAMHEEALKRQALYGTYTMLVSPDQMADLQRPLSEVEIEDLLGEVVIDPSRMRRGVIGRLDGRASIRNGSATTMSAATA